MCDQACNKCGQGCKPVTDLDVAEAGKPAEVVPPLTSDEVKALRLAFSESTKPIRVVADGSQEWRELFPNRIRGVAPIELPAGFRWTSFEGCVAAEKNALKAGLVARHKPASARARWYRALTESCRELGTQVQQFWLTRVLKVPETGIRRDSLTSPQQQEATDADQQSARAGS